MGKTKHVSVRLDEELVDSIDHMADQRELDRTGMITNMLTAALTVRQRSCKRTHTTGKRCGDCGLLPPPSGSALERL